MNEFVMLIDDWGKGFAVGLGTAAIFLFITARYISTWNDKDYYYTKIVKGDKKVREYIPKSEKYYLASYRYLELKAFCRQYQSWKTGLRACYGFKANSFDSSAIRGSEHSDPTERAVELAEKYRIKIDMVDLAAVKADATLAPYIILNVTQALSFEALERMGKRPPCGINQFYEARQKFFWELDQLKE